MSSRNTERRDSYAPKLLRPLADFLRTEAGAGLLLLAMVPLALLWANGPFRHSYETFWQVKATLVVDDWKLSLDLRHWVNDLLMAMFFFVVGLEIKRELVDGELRDARKALTPALAALGGMIAPALLFVTFNIGGDGANGWGIPMATDIAIVLGFLALLGDRVPLPLKTFLLTLAIVDDIGAILVIALFYSPHSLHLLPLLGAVVTCGGYWAVMRSDRYRTVVVVVLALATWLLVYKSGVHATLAGVALALLTPALPHRDSRYVDAEELADVSTVDAVASTVGLARSTVSKVEWLQHIFHPWSSYLVLPFFALANAGVRVTADSLDDAWSSSVALGTAVALLVGKPLGIVAMTIVATKLLHGRLPSGVKLSTVAAGSVLCGVGFTVSLFISDLAFDSVTLTSEAKLGVLFASLLAGIMGFAVLRLTLREESGPAK